MDFLLFKKRIRHFASRLGLLRPLRNLIIKIRGGDPRGKELAWNRRFISPGDLVFDVGANRGQSSEIFIMAGARVVAFEPQKDLHTEIRQLCSNSEHLVIEDCGLGDKEEVRRLFITAYDQVASLREDWQGVRVGETEIRISTLDRQIQNHGLPSYCKIDVEGWELQVLEGLSRPIPLLSFEYHLSRSEAMKALEVLERLSSLGNYHCNIKEAVSDDFALSEFIPLKEFVELFPANLGHSFKHTYGDIFCAIDPSSVAPL